MDEIELLLEDLSSRYPYGVILHFDDKVEQDDEPLYSIRKNNVKYLINDAYYLEEVKPYLRSMESMTEEEKKEYIDLLDETQYSVVYVPDYEPMVKVIKWLTKKMFDYNGLIEKGLAIEAPGDMYK